MHFYNPDDILIEDRLRTATIDSPEVIELAESMKACGQLQPILLSNEGGKLTLIAGLHRLLACKRLERQVWGAVGEDAGLALENPLQRKRAEIQENLRRTDFTPTQLAKGISELDAIMRKLYGEKKPGPGVDAGWTQAETAKMLGYKSHATVQQALMVNRALETGKVPNLEKAQTMQQAAKMVQDVVKIEAACELAARQAKYGQTEIDDPLRFFGNKIILGDCIEGLKGLAPGICNFIITDPPWGIDIDKKVETLKSRVQASADVYEDGKGILSLLEAIIPELARVTAPNAYVVMFCAAKNWHLLSEHFKAVGFQIYSKPLVWAKIHTYGNDKLYYGPCQAPGIWPGSNTDFMVLARKGSPVLHSKGLPDIFLHPPVPHAERIHQAQKPIRLMEEIIDRFYHPDTTARLLDPFVGSGSTLIAAMRLGIKHYFGYEINPKFRERAIARLVKEYYDKEKAAEKDTANEGMTVQDMNFDGFV